MSPRLPAAGIICCDGHVRPNRRSPKRFRNDGPGGDGGFTKIWLGFADEAVYVVIHLIQIGRFCKRFSRTIGVTMTRRARTLNKISALNRPLAVVLGTNAVASAVAVYLDRSGHAVVLAHDPLPPVLRRGMAFHDALYGDRACLEGIEALRIDYVADIYSVLAEKNRVAVTNLGLTDLLVLGSVDVIVDARLQKHGVTPDFRGLARITVGLGPGFTVNENCDLAIETHPLHTGEILRVGATQTATGSAELGGIGSERFACASVAGRWRTAVDIGTRVFKGFVIGHVGGVAVPAPIDGILRGIARDGIEVPAGTTLVEMDPRGRACKWTGLEDGPRAIAEATTKAIQGFIAERRALLRVSPSLLAH